MSTIPCPAPSPHNARSLRVLLVDDHELILTVVGRMIRREKPRMELAGTAHNREEALELARTEHLDVIVLDLDLAGTSGIDLIPELRSLTQAEIIIFSASDDLADHQKSLTAGAFAYVSKLTPAAVLLTAILSCETNRGTA